MYPWYRESVSQYCPPPASMPAAIKTENGFSDCMLALDYAAQAKKGGVWGESVGGGGGGGGGPTNSGGVGGGGRGCGAGGAAAAAAAAAGQQGQGLVHWMSVMAEHMNTVAAHDSPPVHHYMWNGVDQCTPHGKDDYSWTRQSMVKQGYEAKMNDSQNQSSMHKGLEESSTGGGGGSTQYRSQSSGSSSASPPAPSAPPSAASLLIPYPLNKGEAQHHVVTQNGSGRKYQCKMCPTTGYTMKQGQDHKVTVQPHH